MPTDDTIATLFRKSPSQWGLRGDPHLWQAMQTHFAQTPLPDNAEQLVRLIETAFTQLTGQELTVDTHFFVEQFSHGGMSSGLVSPKFWRETAVPLLQARFLAISP
jgi:molybdenum cofactor cytidylyltransferase